MMVATGEVSPESEKVGSRMDLSIRLQCHQKWIKEELERSIRFWLENEIGRASCRERV